MIKSHTDWWFYFIFGGTSRYLYKSGEQPISKHVAQLFEMVGVLLPLVCWFYHPIAMDLIPVLMLLQHFLS